MYSVREGVMAVPQRLEVEEDRTSRNSFCYPEDVISCVGGVELAVRVRTSCA